jgi:hypothetical protein
MPPWATHKRGVDSACCQTTLAGGRTKHTRTTSYHADMHNHACITKHKHWYCSAPLLYTEPPGTVLDWVQLSCILYPATLPHPNAPPSMLPHQHPTQLQLSQAKSDQEYQSIDNTTASMITTLFPSFPKINQQQPHLDVRHTSCSLCCQLPLLWAWSRPKIQQPEPCLQPGCICIEGGSNATTGVTPHDCCIGSILTTSQGCSHPAQSHPAPSPNNRTAAPK